VVLGRESWGTLLALFVPAGPPDERIIRQTALNASGQDEAERELADLDDGALHLLFDRSTPKES
jgi:hypothetical protein